MHIIYLLQCSKNISKDILIYNVYGEYLECLLCAPYLKSSAKLLKEKQNNFLFIYDALVIKRRKKIYL